jgi:hypothetical protein
MFPVDLQFDASATLLWLGEGERPKNSDFEQIVAGPATKKWFLHEAIVEAIESPPPGKQPWVNYKDQVFDLDDIKKLYPAAKRVG